MDEHKQNLPDPWDDGAYGTGRTEPPKDRRGLVTLLLILIIFLGGIITVLSLLNVQMFRQLKDQPEEENTLSISFSSQETCDPEMATLPAPDQDAPQCRQDTIALSTSPQSVANIPTEGGLSLQEIYEKNIGSVVSITTALPRGASSGTGVVVSDQGYIVTNAHVVENALEVSVRLTDDRVFRAGIVGVDPVSDLAVLFIDAQDLQAAEFGDSSILKVGDSVAAIGDPLGAKLRGTMTDGIVSAINRNVTVEGRDLTLIQTNAALNSGNSGGPLINCYGQVIGINTMKIGTFTDQAGVEGLGFAIPSTTVKEIVDQIISQGYVSGRPSLGLRGEALSGFYQHYYRLPPGLFITEVDRGSYADSAGIQPGDILISIDNTRITGMEDLRTALYAYRVGETVTLGLYSGGRQMTVKLTLTESRG